MTEIVDDLLRMIEELGIKPRSNWEARTSDMLADDGMVYVINPNNQAMGESNKPLLILSRRPLTYNQQLMALSLYLEKVGKGG